MKDLDKRPKEAHDTAVRTLQKLLERDAQRKDELWGAIIKSGKSMMTS